MMKEKYFIITIIIVFLILLYDHNYGKQALQKEKEVKQEYALLVHPSYVEKIRAEKIERAGQMSIK